MSTLSHLSHLSSTSSAADPQSGLDLTFTVTPGTLHTATRAANQKLDTQEEMDLNHGGPFHVIPTGQEATGRWTKAEHLLFLEGLKIHGKEWKRVASHVKTRTVVQTRTHAQKYFQKVMKVGNALSEGGTSADLLGMDNGEVIMMMGKDPTTTSKKKRAPKNPNDRPAPNQTKRPKQSKLSPSLASPPPPPSQNHPTGYPSHVAPPLHLTNQHPSGAQGMMFNPHSQMSSNIPTLSDAMYNNSPASFYYAEPMMDPMLSTIGLGVDASPHVGLGFNPDPSETANFLAHMGSQSNQGPASNMAPPLPVQHSGTDRYGRASLPPGFSVHSLSGSGVDDNSQSQADSMSDFANPPPPMTITAPPHPTNRNSLDSSINPNGQNPNLQSPSSTISFFPTPSPAACGKRKHAELTAAAMLATVGTGPKDGKAKKSLNLKNDGTSLSNDGLILNLEMEEEAGPSSTMEEYFKNNGPSLMNPNSNFSSTADKPDTTTTSDFKTPLSSPKTGVVTKNKKGQKVHEAVYPISNLGDKKFPTLSLQIVNPDDFGGPEKHDSNSPSTPWESQIKSLGEFPGTKEAAQNEVIDMAISDFYDGEEKKGREKSKDDEDDGGKTPPPQTHPPTPASLLHRPGSASPPASHAPFQTRYPHPLDFCKRSKLHTCVVMGKSLEVLALIASLKEAKSLELGAKDELGFTPLHAASCLDVYKVGEGVAGSIVKGLLSAGCTPAEKDSTGSTPLHWAARAGNGDVVHILTSAHHPLDATNKDGETALHWALRTGVRGLNSARVLVEDGAKTSIFNKSNKRALDVAAEGFRLAGYPVSPSPTNHKPTEFVEKSPKLAERDEARTNLLMCEPRLRTLVLHHPECLEHGNRVTGVADWECPDRVTAILEKVASEKKEDGTPMFGAHQVTLSSEFDRVSLEVLARCHSKSYIKFVNELSVSLEKEDKNTSAVPFTPAVKKDLMKSQKITLPTTPSSAGMRSLSAGETPTSGLQSPPGTKSKAKSDTTFTAGSLKAARRAAGAVKHAVDRVLLGRNRNAFAVVRPPGHHAGVGGLLEGAESCGFCIFNNIAAGALHALAAHQSRCGKVAIIDIDVHHGNGTQEIVKNFTEPHRLFFFSAHLWDTDEKTDYTFYPGSGSDSQEDGGEENPNIINVPIAPQWRNSTVSTAIQKNKAKEELEGIKEEITAQGHNTRGGRGRGKREEDEDKGEEEDDEEKEEDEGGGEEEKVDGRSRTYPQHYLKGTGYKAYRAAIEQRLLPALRKFNPDLILLSSGFDAANHDVGNAKHIAGGKQRIGINLAPDDYLWTTEKICEVADECCSGRVISVLEGGYGRTVVPKSTTRSSAQAAGPGGLEIQVPLPTPALDRAGFAECAAAHLMGLVDSYAPDPDNDSDDENDAKK
ncbi:hypothetical protein TL16_g08191 [Triparma laevis f. inornata]|uniref:histone deacetylase n=1 Tax=Triparma laevis f. inornata TaxID=1714386 RepID=A0A9W7EFU8_9STRA|nr:hypothetical protein TL16_g08191 [Triparma laevis f. inornata]